MALAPSLAANGINAEREAQIAALEARREALRVVIEDAVLERHQIRERITELRIAPPGVDPREERNAR